MQEKDLSGAEERELERAEEHEVEISVEKFHDPTHERHHFRMPRGATLLEVLDKGARGLDEHLLPSPEEPLDKLRGVYQDHQAGEPLNLELTLGEFLREEPRTHHFAVELVLAIRINTRWRIAPENEMTPKEILALADLSWEEYSLYYPQQRRSIAARYAGKISPGRALRSTAGWQVRKRGF